VRYLGITIKSGLSASADFAQSILSFYKAFNAIFRRTRFADSELVSVFLLKSICVPILTYGVESVCAAPSAVKNLDRILDNALRKIFGVSDPDDIIYIRQVCDLPFIAELRQRKTCKLLYDLAHNKSIYSEVIFRLAASVSYCTAKYVKDICNIDDVGIIAKVVRECAFVV
jgi:hypothetical protein